MKKQSSAAFLEGGGAGIISCENQRKVQHYSSEILQITAKSLKSPLTYTPSLSFFFPLSAPLSGHPLPLSLS